MRISDWSSYVCSSDLLPGGPGPALAAEKGAAAGIGAESTGAGEPAPVIAMPVADCRRLLARIGSGDVLYQPDPGVNYQPGRDVDSQGRPIAPAPLPGSTPLPLEIGRASCRGRVCQYVSISVVDA